MVIATESGSRGRKRRGPEMAFAATNRVGDRLFSSVADLSDLSDLG